MSLRQAYEAELRKAQAASDAAGAPRREAVERLRAFYDLIMAEGLPDTSLEVEFREEELLIDPGAIMITVRVTEQGGFRLFYEVKRPDAYATTEIPAMNTIDDLTRVIACLLVQHR